MTTIADHDAYIAAAPEQFQSTLRHVRALLARTLPEAEEIVAYNMPGFKIDDTIVAGYAAFSKQCGLYVQPDAIAQCSEQIAAAGLKATKTGVTFSLRKPIPDDLVIRLAQASRHEAEA